MAYPAGASAGRRRLQGVTVQQVLSPTAALTQIAAVQGPVFGVLAAAGAAMVVGEAPVVISGGTLRSSLCYDIRALQCATPGLLIHSYKCGRHYCFLPLLLTSKQEPSVVSGWSSV